MAASYHWVGDFLLFKARQIERQWEVMWEIEQGISEENLVKLIATKATISQFEFEDDYEFEYEGMMYDVIRKEVINQDTTIYFCLADEKEMDLIANYKKSRTQNFHFCNASDDVAKKIPPLFFEVHTVSNRFVFPAILLTSHQPVLYLDNYQSPFRGKNLPPPKSPHRA